MSQTEALPGAEVRISPEDVQAFVRSGRPITFLDMRNDQPWDAGTLKIAGAVRVRPAEWRIAPSWPKDRLTVVY